MSLLILFSGSEGGAVVTPLQNVAVRIEMQFAPAVWTTNTDVLGDEDVYSWRGIRDNGPDGNVAEPGTMTFALANDATNSGGVLGYYSPSHGNCRPGFGLGTPVRLIYTLNGTDVVLWTGKLVDINPTPGTAGIKRTYCQATSNLSDFLEHKIREIPPQLNKTDVELLSAVLAAVPTESQPPSVNFDPAVDTYKAAMVDLEGGVSALAVIKRVEDSTRGIYFERGDGSHRHISRVRRALSLVQFVFTDSHLNPETGIVKPSKLEDGSVANRFVMTTHAVAVGATASDVLFSLDGPFSINPGDMVEMFIDYKDASDVKFGGTDFQDPPTSGVDYSFNALENGSGADLTGSIAVNYDFFVTTCKVTLTNTGGVIAYKQILQGRGRKLLDLKPVSVEAFAPRPYGVRTTEIDLSYQHDPAKARDLAAFYQSRYADLSNMIDSIEFLANQSAEVLEQAVMREIGDVVRVSESVTGTSLVDGYIQWIEWRIQPGLLITCRYGLAPRIETEIFASDSVQVDDDLDIVTAAPESRIGHARINYSEIAA